MKPTPKASLSKHITPGPRGKERLFRPGVSRMTDVADAIRDFKSKPALKLRNRPPLTLLGATLHGTYSVIPKPRILNGGTDGKTVWYPGHQKPMRVGVYEREGPSPEYPYSWWNGVFWCIGGRTPEEAVKPIHRRIPGGPQPDKWYVCPSHVQDARWRGLTREHASEERAHNAPE